MFGSPQGVQSVKKDDFVRLLPKRKEFFRNAGLAASKLDSLESSMLDSQHVLAKVVWKMRFERGGKEPVENRNGLPIFSERTEIPFRLYSS